MRSRLAFVAALQVLLAVTLLLAACDIGDFGGPNGNTGPTATSTFTPTPTLTPTPDPAAALTLNPTHSDTVGGLELTVVGITQVSTEPYSRLGFACSPGLAFSSSTPTTVGYSASELRAIRGYVTTVPLTHNGYPIPDSQPPSSLRWLALGTECAARLDVHNGGNQQVTISMVGVQLVADAVANTYHYAQLDICSVSDRFNPCGYNSQGPDDGYFATVAMAPRGSGTTFQGKVDTNDPSAVPMLLLSGQTKSIAIVIAPTDIQAPGAIYRVVPQLTVSDSATHVVTFSGLRQTIVFANRSEISCYGVSGNSVLPVSQISYNPNYHSIC